LIADGAGKLGSFAWSIPALLPRLEKIYWSSVKLIAILTIDRPELDSNFHLCTESWTASETTEIGFDKPEERNWLIGFAQEFVS